MDTQFGSTIGTLRLDEGSFLILYYVLHHIGIINLPMQIMLIRQMCTLVVKF